MKSKATALGLITLLLAGLISAALAQQTPPPQCPAGYHYCNPYCCPD